MDHYVGIDVSLDESSVCVVDATGRIVREAKVASEPEALIGFLGGLDLRLARIGLEAGPLSQWLQAALVKAGFEAVLMESQRVLLLNGRPKSTRCSDVPTVDVTVSPSD